LLVFLSFGFEPLLATLIMEEVATSWDAHDGNAISESVHANNAVLAIEFVHLLSVGHFFKGSNELSGVQYLNFL
jgi:hypothetical protein